MRLFGNSDFATLQRAETLCQPNRKIIKSGVRAIACILFFCLTMRHFGVNIELIIRILKIEVVLMAELKRLNARVRVELHEWLQKSAEDRGLTMNAMIILALETYLQQQQVLPILPQLMKQFEIENKEGK
jgi:hypothetical protein